MNIVLTKISSCSLSNSHISFYETQNHRSHSFSDWECWCRDHCFSFIFEWIWSQLLVRELTLNQHCSLSGVFVERNILHVDLAESSSVISLSVERSLGYLNMVVISAQNLWNMGLDMLLTLWWHTYVIVIWKELVYCLQCFERSAEWALLSPTVRRYWEFSFLCGVLCIFSNKMDIQHWPWPHLTFKTSSGLTSKYQYNMMLKSFKGRKKTFAD